MNKYLAVFMISWQQGLVYRLNFLLWRVRSVLQLLLVYFIWFTVSQTQNQIFGYSQDQILTYVVVSALIRAIVLSSKATDISDQINQGSIVNFLLKPLGFIKYYCARDLADKMLNIFFVIIEISLLLFLLKPQVIVQTDILYLFEFFLAVFLGMILFFSITFMIGLLAFWVENSWGPLFLGMILLEGFGGGLFPIDILPKSIFNLIMLTPFPYLIYFPSKIYIGGLPENVIYQGFAILIFWVIFLWIVMNKVLKAGLRQFTAVGG